MLSIKMVFDRETGKPKGYGFIEFPDVPTAELAIRNLNGLVTFQEFYCKEITLSIVHRSAFISSF